MNILSELAGKVARIAVSPDQSVNAGQELLIIESMKMEIPVESEISGKVMKILVQAGDEVEEGQPVAELN